MFLFDRSEAVEFQRVKLETICAVILPPTVTVRWLIPSPNTR